MQLSPLRSTLPARQQPQRADAPCAALLAGCTKNALTGKISCLTDTEYIASIRALRAALPRPYILSTAPWSIGAYGEGAFVNAQPQGAYTGVAINALRTAGADLDLLNVMSYDASDALNVTEAYDAYRALFPGALPRPHRRPLPPSLPSVGALFAVCS
jgi:hypothetical protein